MSESPKQCSDAFCRCHDTFGGGCCADCKVKDILIITLAIGLADKTWIERDIEIEDDESFWDGEEINNSAAEEAAWAKVPEDEQNRLAPSFWKLIHWERKD